MMCFFAIRKVAANIPATKVRLTRDEDPGKIGFAFRFGGARQPCGNASRQKHSLAGPTERVPVRVRPCSLTVDSVTVGVDQPTVLPPPGTNQGAHGMNVPLPSLHQGHWGEPMTQQ